MLPVTTELFTLRWLRYIKASKHSTQYCVCLQNTVLTQYKHKTQYKHSIKASNTANTVLSSGDCYVIGFLPNPAQSLAYTVPTPPPLKVALHDAIYCRQHYLSAPTSPASLAQHIAYPFTRSNILQLRC